MQTSSSGNHAHHVQSTYDYIVVGSGAAGATLASEIRRRELGSVLLIEAGHAANSPRLRVPSSYPLAFGSQWDWGYQTTPQSGMARRRMPLPAGRSVGGSTSINAMIYIEPNSEDFLSWQSVAGEQWAPFKVARDFEALRANMEMAQQTMPSMHRHANPASTIVPSLPELHPALQGLLDCVSFHGWLAETHQGGFSHPTAGIAPYQRMQRHGRRVSVMDLWFPSSSRDSNTSVKPVTLLSGTVVRRILIHDQRAVGVELMHASEISTVQARRGILVAAGAFGSPQLLLQSGIGPVDWLKHFGIQRQHDAAELGTNLQDHLVVPIVMKRPEGRPFRFPFDAAERIRYVKTRTGPRASNIAELGGFFDSTSSPSDLRSNSQPIDFQWHITPTHYLEYPRVHSERSALSFGVTAMRPTSRGRMTPCLDLRSTDPAGPISWTIDPAYLTAPGELEEWVRALDWTRTFLNHPAWENRVLGEQLPGPQRNSQSAIETFVRRMASTLYHYSGTCSMGTHSSSTIDPHFRTRGVDRLWVCDASAMPQLPGCNPQSTIMMMATRLASELQ